MTATNASVLHQTSFENPFGILPLGMALIKNDNKRQESLGTFNALPDELLHELISRLSFKQVAKLAAASSYFYCFCYGEDIWRELCLQEFQGNFDFYVNWRLTFAYMKSGLQNEMSVIKCRGVYSDLLYTSWRCQSVDLDELCSTKRSNIDRRSNLSYNDFVRDYAQKNRPVIITDIVSNWPAYKMWNLESFIKSDREFRAEKVDLTYDRYLKYLKQCNEEAPLYLFDKRVLEDHEKDYTVPEYFGQDLFSVLGDKRPDYKWLIVGPKRSGSTFHKDPNSTSAWNAVIVGSKKWILYPPDQIPPGVFPTKNGDEVTAPVNLTEWYLNYYSLIHEDSESFKPIEGVCNAGEIIFVPRGWWHSVMNLESTLAITQNFVSRENVVQVVRFLKNKPDQVSGYKGDLYKDFMENLDRDTLEYIESFEDLYSSKRGKWANLTAAAESSNGFEFKF